MGPTLERRPHPGNASGVPLARLLSAHRTGMSNVLIVGGGAGWRRGVAEAFHRESTMRRGPLVHVDGREEEEQLVRALHQSAIGRAAPGVDRLRAAAHGTLFVDWVTWLSPRAQRLLLSLAARDPFDLTDRDGWPGSLVVGTPEDPGRAVAEGRFSSRLFDALDKIRVEAAEPMRGAA